MARAKKEYRELTVSEATNYGRKTAPMLRIQGLWFQELGFNIGDPVLVKCEDGKLIITQEPNAGNPLTKGLTPLLTFDVSTILTI